MKYALDVPKRKTPTYNFTAKQLEAFQREAHKKGVAAGVYMGNAMYSVALLLTLRDRLGYGQTRLKRIFNAVQKLFGEIADGEVAYKDLAQTLYDECGINLIIERPDEVPIDTMEMFESMEKTNCGIRIKEMK